LVQDVSGSEIRVGVDSLLEILLGISVCFVARTMTSRIQLIIACDIEMTEEQIDLCGKCGAEIDPSRRVDFTLKDGTRVCDACFVKETPRQTLLKSDWSN